MVVFALGKNLLFKSALGHCDFSVSFQWSGFGAKVQGSCKFGSNTPVSFGSFACSLLSIKQNNKERAELQNFFY